MLDEEESSTESEPEEAVPVEVELTWRALVTSCDQLDDPTTCAQQAEVGPCVCVGCRQILSCTRISPGCGVARCSADGSCSSDRQCPTS